MKRHLYVFGYEPPEERESNVNHGTDFESSRAVLIVFFYTAPVDCTGANVYDAYVKPSSNRSHRIGGVS